LVAAAELATFDDVGQLFTALEDQLGLKLEATRGPVNVVVIDAVDRPTPN
jgi:bla regulator protein blaR1